MDSNTVGQKFKLTLYGSKNEFEMLQGTLQSIRTKLNECGRANSNLSILKTAAEKYQVSLKHSNKQLHVERECSRTEFETNLLVTTQSSIEHLNKIHHSHSIHCSYEMSQTITQTKGLQRTYTFSCPHCSFSADWRSSPKLQGGKDLVTLRVMHGVLCSGIDNSQITRLLKSTSLGSISLYTYHMYLDLFSKYVKQEKESSCAKALYQEIQSCDESNSVDIITDARHGTRRNSKFTDVVCVGYKTEKVIGSKVVSRSEDPCTQRHELIGTKSIYKTFDEQNVKVRRHVHDRNASVNKFVATERKATVNQNDTWHVSVSIGKQMKKISNGAKCREGKTWSLQLVDKVGPVKTHVQYALRYCEGDKAKLIEMLDNVVPHYENKHGNCLPNSRCNTDPNYQPSRIMLTDSFAKQLLSTTIKSFDVYKHPDSYKHAMCTYPVESFNNTLNIFHDKRIGSFGNKHYNLKSNMSVCHWNENIKSNQKKATHKYAASILSRCISQEFHTCLWRPF